MLSARMGELVVSSRAGDELVALGLGSCIGLAMIDRSACVAGLVHVVLPASNGPTDQPGKFADLAVPELLAKVIAAGAVKRRLEIVIGGGAQMFDVGDRMDIGARNTEAVTTALRRAGLTISNADTGGSQGRTVRVDVASGAVTARVAGGDTRVLLAGSPGRREPACPRQPLSPRPAVAAAVAR